MRLSYLLRIMLLLLPSIFLCPVLAADEPQAKKAADKIKEVAGSAELLRSVPKRFAILKAIALGEQRVTLLIKGQALPKLWTLVSDGEIKVAAWSGRPY